MCKEKGKRTVLTACSDGIGVERKDEIQLLIEKLSQIGILAQGRGAVWYTKRACPNVNEKL